MDIQQLLAVNIMLVCGLALAGAMLQSAWRDQLLWMAVNGLVVAAGAAMLLWAPDAAGTIATLLFVPLVLAPVVLQRMTQSRLYQRRMSEALRLARIAAWVHPTRQTRLNAAMIEAQASSSLSAQIAALRALAQRSAADLRPAIEAAALRLDGQWEALLDLLQRNPDLARSMASLRVRALGETGQIDQMTRVYDDAKAHMHGGSLLEAQLFLLAFAGRSAETAQLLAGPLAALDADTRDYWLAVADRAAGADPAHWRSIIERLAAGAASPGARRAAQQMLAAPESGRRQRLDDVSTVIIEECAARLQRLDAPAATGTKRTPVTFILLAVVVAAYVLSEARGGASNLRTLVDLGALQPSLVLNRGEWWRLATAMFLHYGVAHAAINGFMLLVLGRACERAFGSWRMALIYGLGGVASSGFVLWLMAAGWSEAAVLVGASGAIMALFGAIGARSLVSWLRHRDVLDGRNLVWLAVIAGLQVAVDLASPQVSLAAHASGFVVGLVVGSVLTLAGRGRRRSTA